MSPLGRLSSVDHANHIEMSFESEKFMYNLTALTRGRADRFRKYPGKLRPRVVQPVLAGYAVFQS